MSNLYSTLHPQRSLNGRHWPLVFRSTCDLLLLSTWWQSGQHNTPEGTINLVVEHQPCCQKNATCTACSDAQHKHSWQWSCAHHDTGAAGITAMENWYSGIRAFIGQKALHKPPKINEGKLCSSQCSCLRNSSIQVLLPFLHFYTPILPLSWRMGSVIHPMMNAASVCGRHGQCTIRCVCVCCPCTIPIWEQKRPWDKKTQWTMVKSKLKCLWNALLVFQRETKEIISMRDLRHLL